MTALYQDRCPTIHCAVPAWPATDDALQCSCDETGYQTRTAELRSGQHKGHDEARTSGSCRMTPRSGVRVSAAFNGVVRVRLEVLQSTCQNIVTLWQSSLHVCVLCWTCCETCARCWQRSCITTVAPDHAVEVQLTSRLPAASVGQ